ncbi:phosphotransferase [Shewanella livingstonensis]|uniref:Aminoglycoside phosphotransferase n=1 Tax=Shewanella livingstonensis TaxID=150120 RepID=A0A3G8LXT9_9GAMM|nr:phosphotransferase [Shewanella livingstonensis]AZG73712.1 aminoglycoside phosphotransferase [Shewanella livingstonensis]
MPQPLLSLPTDVLNIIKQTMPAVLFQQLVLQCSAVSIFNTGISNVNIKLSCDDGDKVLRVNQPHSNWCDRALEVECWQAAIVANIAPELIWVSDNKQVYLSEFIDQPGIDWSIFSTMHSHASIEQATKNSISDLDVVRLLSEVFRTLSTLPVPHKSMTVSAQWQQYAQQLDSVNSTQTDPQWHHAWQQLLRLNGLVRHWLSQLEACALLPAFCHRDLTPDNLLLSGRSSHPKLLCIDFEYAVASHPLFDLASVVATHQLSISQVNQLIENVIMQYCQTSNLTDVAAAKAALPAAINCFWLFSAMWALLMAAKEPKISTQYLHYFTKYFTLITC